MSLSVLLALALRYVLVVLFFPFSALDKIINFQGAVGQARHLVPRGGLAATMIAAGVFIEIVMPLGILTGVADRLAAFIMAGYCVVTAILFKQFWTPGDFWHTGESKGRNLFWDFLKNFSLAGGFLLITFGIGAATAGAFFQAPLSSTHPYAAQQEISGR